MSRIPLSNRARLLAEIKRFLESFQSSSNKFALFGHADSQAGTITLGRPPPDQRAPKTLFILDSSYNPPSRAHFALASSALTSPAARDHPGPHGLLLLFSTANADKAPQPASFEQRVAMMSCVALDIAHRMSLQAAGSSIGIGVTTEPYYVGKSQAIEGDTDTYPARPRHVHIIGYDTVTRFLAPRYYQGHSPPLSALRPYFDAGHGLLVALRPESSSGNTKDAGSQPAEEQRAYVDGLGRGALRDEGFEPQWAERIRVMEGEGLGVAIGVSSTAIRSAVEGEDSAAIDELCTPSVAAWIRDQGLYVDEAKPEA